MARKSRKNLEPTAVTMAPSMCVYNAAAYIRQSSDGKRKPSDTLETQRDIIENYVTAAPDIQLVEVYIDNNRTGTSFDRPDFQRMLEDVESGKIDCIICKDLSRFGRNAIDAGYYLERYLPQLGVRFIAITDSYDSNDGDGGLMIPLKNIIAETYALDISRKCRAVHQQNIQDGRFVGRLAPYGYLKDPNNCRHLIVDATAAVVVRQMYEWCGKGATDGEVVRRLNETGVLTPSQYKQAQGFTVSGEALSSPNWQKRTVGDMLSDPMYMGDMAQGRTRTVNGKQLAIPREEWIIVPNTHEAIVSRELFSRVQQLRKTNSENDKANRSKPVPYTTNVLAGKVFCARCGHPLHRHRQANHDYYWFRCESQWKFGKHTCVQVSVKEDELKATVMTMLHKQAEAVLGGYVMLERRKPVETTAFDRELKEINQTLSKSGWMLSSLYENMVNGVITQDEFGHMKADYKAQIDTLSSRADELREKKRDLERQSSEQYSYADALSAALSNDTLTAEIINCLIGKILVNPDKSFTVYFRYQDEFMGSPANRRFVGERRSSVVSELSASAGSEGYEACDDEVRRVG